MKVPLTLVLRALFPRRLVVAGTLVLAATAGGAQDAEDAGWAGSIGALELRGGLDIHSAYDSMNGSWWNLAATASPGFTTSRSFAEFWVQPKLDGRYPLNPPNLSLSV
jgi:hypothetical protein